MGMVLQTTSKLSVGQTVYFILDFLGTNLWIQDKCHLDTLRLCS